jgi:polysaccharide deacetylase family protein (PEP-CTERM system associated)
MKAPKSHICALTVDTEEWFQVENLRGAIKKTDWNNKQSSVEKNTRTILKLLAGENISATFFILGWVAEKNPDLIKQISDEGHEVASHGTGHDLTYALSHKELEKDIYLSKKKLEDISGKEVKGYRAPNFSVDDRLIEILKNLDFKYDSSYNPFRLNKRYGSIKLPDEHSGQVFEIGDQFYEIPISTLDIFSFPLPVAGGAYFRLLPLSLFKGLVKKVLFQKCFYNFYLHPWEFEPDQPRMNNIKLNYKIRHYTGLKHTKEKFIKLISYMRDLNTRFLTLDAYLCSILDDGK